VAALFQSRRHIKRRYQAPLVFFALLLLAWIWGLLAFVDTIPSNNTDNQSAADAIVVLTGGSERLETGFSLLAGKRAKKLFVSGVYEGVEVRQLLMRSQSNPQELLCCVSLGYSANSTASNAIETAAWMRKEGFTSILLVTASYHMPRSLKEFRHALPNSTIIPHAVFPQQFKRDQWYLWPGTASLIVSEFVKYIVASARHVVAGSPPESNR